MIRRCALVARARARSVAAQARAQSAKGAYLAALAAVAVAALCTPAFCYLRVHPSNPHYFQETTTGKAILIATVSGLVPESLAWDDIASINQTILRRRLPYARVWHLFGYTSSNSVEPWAFSNQPGACYGIPYKFDLDTWNPTYWTRLRNSISVANAAGVYIEMMVFDRCQISPAAQSRWGTMAWASENNINNLETPTCEGDGTPAFYRWSTKPNLRNQQERYVRKVIDETITYPNVFYEVENEHWSSNSAGWADHYGQFIKDYIAANYPNSPRLTSYSSILSDVDLDQCYTWPAIDVVSRHYGGELEANPSQVNGYIEARWHYNKPINIDEFANGVTDPNILRQECWTIVTSGGNYHIEDATDLAKPWDICANIRSFIALSGWDFISSSPDHTLVTSGGGYCMKNPGVEYVCYFPTGGSKTVSIAAGSYREEWWNPRTGGFYNITSYSHGGGDRTLAPPDANDWVLHVTAIAAPTTTLNSLVAGAITIDGLTSDWNLSAFTTKIHGGSAGAGSIGIVDFDTDGVCYVGGHYDDWQFLPLSASDHAVRIYARDNASYLYFLVRCDDSDMRYSSSASSNSNNDCVHFFIDPGHDHGTSVMSNSTSDVDLVIDANNQKYIYNTTSGYRTTILAGVNSAVVRDSTGWWLEARIQKSVFSPAIPATGAIGIDFAFRDNDSNNSLTLTTITSWRDPEVSISCPTKIPNRWGDLTLQTVPDTTAPGPVTSLVAVAGDRQVSLSWHNPSDSDFAGTMIRCKTTGYPTGPTDGTLVVDNFKSPNTNDTCVDLGLTNTVTRYYSAFAHDAAPNYATKADASATPADTLPPSPVTSFAVVVGNERNFLAWTNPADADLAGVKVLFKTTGYPSSPTDGTVAYQGAGTSFTHESLTNGTPYYYAAYAYDEVPNYPIAAQADGSPIYVSPVQAKMLGDGEQLTLTVGAISALFGDWFYVQSPPLLPPLPTEIAGPCGIKILGSSYGLHVGQSVTAKGTIQTDVATGERYISATWRNVSGSGTVDPLGMTNLALGGSDWNYNAGSGAGQQGVVGSLGTNNISLLVRAWGNVTQRDTSGLAYFYIDDGSNLRDTTQTGVDDNVGVRVKADPSSHTAGDYVVVTGISSCFRDGSGNLRRQVVPMPPPPSGPTVVSTSTFDSDANGWSISTWKAHATNYQLGTMAWALAGGSPGGCMASTGSGATDNLDHCTREGGEIFKTISTSNHGGIKIYYDLMINSLGGDYTGTGTGGCPNDHDVIDEQITVFYSTDGGANWTEAEYIMRDDLLAGYQTYGTRTIDLSGITACDNNPNFALRFRWQFNTATDTGWLDNIRVEADI